MNRILFLTVLTLITTIAAPAFSEDSAYETCMKNSPYANKDVADKECRGQSDQVMSVPEKLATDDQAHAIQDEINRQNFLDAQAALILHHKLHSEHKK